MNNYIKYILRIVIVGVPLYIIKQSYLHVRSCDIQNCTFCALSNTVLAFCIFMLSALAITWLIDNWDEIWED